MAASTPDFQLFSSLRFDPILRQCQANTDIGNEESRFYMLPYHRDRMMQAAEHFQWPEAISRISGPEGLKYLEKSIEAAVDTKPAAPLRVRTLLHHDGRITVESNETPVVPASNLFPARLPPPQPKAIKVSPLTGGALLQGVETLDGDPERKNPWTVIPDPERTKASPFTSYKTTCREMYNSARARASIVKLTEAKEVLIISEAGDEIMEGSTTSVFFWRHGKWVTPPIASGGQVGTTRRWLLEKGFCKEEVVKASSLVEGEECWISNGVRGLSWGTVKLQP